MSKPLLTELKRSKYRLLGLIGQGQFGRVYCASHRATGRLVALKDLDRQRFPTHKFLRELRFLLSLKHPNIVTCQALEHTHNGRYLVMDYCEGGTMRQLMEQQNCLHLGQGIKLVMDILAGLEHAHGHGIVHCDIKPENILLNVQSNGWTARISDFGIARLSQELAMEAGNTGSPAYMAPERFYGQYSQASDLYAVGVILFELVAGHRPFSGAPSELMLAHMNAPLKLPEEMPAALQTIVATALQKLPARRFRSAAEMLEMLQKAAVESGWTSWLEAPPMCVPLTPAEELSSPSPFQSQTQDVLVTPVQTVVVGAAPVSVPSHTQAPRSPSSAPQWIYRAVNKQERVCVEIAPWLLPSGENFEPPRPVTVIPWAENIQALVVRPQGCFAIAPHSLTLLHPTLPTPFSLLATKPTTLLAIEPDGHWLATLTPAVNPTEVGTLNLWKLPKAAAPGIQLHALKQNVPCPAGALKLLILDQRHLGIVSRTAPSEVKGNDKTRLEVFTRHGKFVGAWTLPVAVAQIYTTELPYHLIAQEQGDPTALLLITLKPLKVTRIRAEMTPQLITPTPWGCAIVDTFGQILLLNHHGDRIGWIQPPSDFDNHTDVTALCSFSGYGLLLSTWNSQQQSGSLYSIDLRQLDLDILF